MLTVFPQAGSSSQAGSTGSQAGNAASQTGSGDSQAVSANSQGDSTVPPGRQVGRQLGLGLTIPRVLPDFPLKTEEIHWKTLT